MLFSARGHRVIPRPRHGARGHALELMARINPQIRWACLSSKPWCVAWHADGAQVEAGGHRGGCRRHAEGAAQGTAAFEVSGRGCFLLHW